MFVRKLVISNLLVRKVRAALTVAAVGLSVCLVVAVTTGYASVLGAVNAYFDKFLGTTDAIVSKPNVPRGSISENVVDALRADPDVKRANGRVEWGVPVSDANSKENPPPSRLATINGIDPATDNRTSTLKIHEGRFINSTDAPELVIDQALAAKLELKVGSKAVLGGERPTVLTVVGIIHKPEAMAQASQEAYAPIRTLQRHIGFDASGPGGPRLSKVYVELKRGVDPRAFEGRFKEALKAVDPAARVTLTRDARDQLDKGMRNVELLSYLGGAVSMAAATFIVFSALSMGVAERQRGLATLRAIGASRGQVARLVFGEGVLLAGSGAALGAPLGVFCIVVLAWWFNDVFTAGVVVSWRGILLGVGGTLLTALAAGALPAWQATRVKPLEAMAPAANPPGARVPWVAAVVGFLLVCVDPFLFFGPVDRITSWFGPADVKETATLVKFILHFAIGLPAMFVGFFLLAPAVVKATEAALSGLTARAMGVSPQLLRQQLSTGLWRAAGTASALMVGLAVLVVMQVQGNSALRGWRLPNKFPDLFLYYSPSVSTEASTATAANLTRATTGPASRPATPPAASPFNPWKLLSSSPKPATAPAAPATVPTRPPLVAIATTTAPAAAPTTAPSTQPSLFAQLGRQLFGLRPNAGDGKAGVALDDLAKVKSVPGVAQGKVMPIAIASPDFGHGLGGLLMTMAASNATMYFGIDPAVAFEMMELEFRDGNDAAAKRFMTDGQAVVLKRNQTWLPKESLVATRGGQELAAFKGFSVYERDSAGHPTQFALQGMVTRVGDAYRVELPAGGTRDVPADAVERVEHGLFLIVTNEFKELKGIGVGDTFPLKRDRDGKSVEFTVVGVVWSPGIDVITAMFDLGRQFEQRTAHSVFGSVRDAKEVFGVERVYVFGVNLEPGADPQVVVKEINKRFGSEGLRAGDIRAIKRNIETAFDRLLLLASTVAFAALAVASLGVTNTVMAGIRTRRWQFGVLRSIGVTRGQLTRLVLAEAVLLGIVATVLGLTAGAALVLDAHALQLALTGYDPPIAVPWGVVSIGVGVVLTVALAASLWPATNVARTEPLKLLQAGRASA
ncbi:MAG TPA: FtsX-like permease family protein [Humisphaera sp.]